MVVFTVYYILIHIGKFDEIIHFFLFPGQSFMPGDSDFGVIETIFCCADDWKYVVEECTIKDPFTVAEKWAAQILLLLKTLLDTAAKIISVYTTSLHQRCYISEKV